MSIKLPDLARIDYTALDYDGIVQLTSDLIKDHPDYFSNVDDFISSNAGRVTIEVVAFIISMLTDRVDWDANENLLPTATQKTSVMNALKLINYRLSLPYTAACTVRASINSWVEPFSIPARYIAPAIDLDRNKKYFELLNKDRNNKYIYEGTGSAYEFNTGYSVAPILNHDNLVFYEGRSYREFFTMQGIDNEFVKLGKLSIEEGSIRVWKVSRDSSGNIVSQKELTLVTSFISPEAQNASDVGLPPCKIQNTENNSAYLVFGESAVVSIFSTNGLDEIMVWYRVTSGSVGNITLGALSYTTNITAGGNTIQINYVNLSAGSGGTESETKEHAQKYGPLSLTAVEKTVNPNDFVVLLQENTTIMNSITYGKSNEPNKIYDDFGYHIPPFESWIYPVMNKLGWESFKTYSYPMSMIVGRPYTPYGIRDKEIVVFSTNELEKDLTKLKYSAKDNDYSNLRVSEVSNKNLYIPGQDYVIDIEARSLIRLSGGGIGENDAVLVRYYENSNQEEYVKINFATGDEQPIARTPVFPGIRTYAWSLDALKVFSENDLSSNDYDYPNNDYVVDYLNGTIKRNSIYPYIDSKITIYESTDMGEFPYSSTTPSVLIKAGVNNEVLISLEGLNRSVLNADHDFKFDSFSGWATIGEGQSIDFGSSGDYSFKMSVDSGEYIEYVFTLGAPVTYTPKELANEIATGCTPAFPNTVEIFIDYIHYEQSPKITIMSKTTGITSRIQLDGGVTGTSLFDITNAHQIDGDNTGENITIEELAERCRATLNYLGLCNSYVGRGLAASKNEFPSVYSKSDISSPSTFSFSGSDNQINFTLVGTNGNTHDGTTTVIFSTGTVYDLTTWQGRMDLLIDMQSDIDGINGFDDQDVVKVIWLRGPSGYRIGFQQVDIDWSDFPTITMSDATSNSCRSLLKLGEGQSSSDTNLVEAQVSTKSDMVNSHYLRFRLYGAFGENAKIQVKANNGVHNNTLNLMQLGDDQVSYGTSVMSNTIIGKYDWLGSETGTYTFTDTVDNRFNMYIVGIPEGDGDYTITIPAATYNIESLVDAINTAFSTSDMTGTPTDISDRIVCEKVEGKNKIRIRLISYDLTKVPDVEINDTEAESINRKCIDALGLTVGESMSDYSTIILHYEGDYITDSNADQSDSTSIIRYLVNNRLISQDYIINDPKYTSFDIKGTVYVEKGFDRDVAKSQVITKLRDKFSINEREFAVDLTVSSVIDIIKEVEGIDSLIVDYLGKDYQQYSNYINRDKSAIIEASFPASNVVSRWNTESAFKISLDGCTVAGVNYDGEYLVVVGNTWSDRDYNSLLDAILHGDGTTGGLEHAISLRMGEGVVDLNGAVSVQHSSGIFKFSSINEGTSVFISLESPEQIFTRGYQTLNRTNVILETEYSNSVIYSIGVDIDGAGSVNYEITSPASGDWPLYKMAEALEASLPSTVIAGIDGGGKIRVTSLLGGFSSTINITAGISGTDILTIVGPADVKVNGTAGYVDCLAKDINGTLNMGTPVTSYGIENEPTLEDNESIYNYQKSIPANYDEIIYLSDDYFAEGSTLVVSQLHGIILTYVETGR